MDFPIRYVPFGTRFHAAPRHRHETRSEPAALHENELVVDVGGCCWGYNTDLPILDHHLVRDGNFPSASCAVLHNAGKIANRFGGMRQVWLVTHENADFDAYCSTYLAQNALEGEFSALDLPALRLHPDGWQNVDGKPRFDWFKPNPAYLPDRHVWAFLLASVAAHVDNGRRMVCPPTSTLAAFLYACMERGVNFETETGARFFFDAVRATITEDKLNPLVDSVLQNNPGFAAERELLRLTETAYQQDFVRARKALVYLPVTQNFEQFYNAVAAEPLIEDGKLSSAQSDMRTHKQGFRQADGIYIRDPQCFLFHHLARQDTGNSKLGQGFLFTAVAYSGQKEERRNSTRYIFSLDPERADGAHLYPVWSALQFEELRLLRKSDVAPPPGTKARPLYEKRAAEEQSLFHDPWFDGLNYVSTLVETPHSGTLIDGGRAPDLTDDPVTDIVRQCVESVIFAGPAAISDFSCAAGLVSETTAVITARAIPALDRDRFRFAAVLLAEDVDLLQRASVDQAAQRLAAVLHPDHRHPFPEEFLHKHTMQEKSMIGFSDAVGVAVGYLPTAADGAREMRRIMADIASLSGKVRDAMDAKTDDPERYRPLLAEVARLELELTQPQNRLLGPFFEANRFAQVLGLVHQLYSTGVSENHLQQIAAVQRNTELLEVLVISVYATELAHVIAGEKLHEVWPLAAVGYYALAAIGTGVAVYVSSSKEESKAPPSKSTLAYLGIWFLLILLLGALLGVRAHEEAVGPHGDPTTRSQPATKDK